MARDTDDEAEPLVDFDQTNGQAEGLDGDSDGTAANDLATREARRRRAFTNTVIGGIGSRRI